MATACSGLRLANRGNLVLENVGSFCVQFFERSIDTLHIASVHFSSVLFATGPARGAFDIGCRRGPSLHVSILHSSLTATPGPLSQRHK